jgi:hypothetical protein
MPNARVIPILNLKPDQELTADQIVQMANGELKVLTDDGEKVGIVLQRKDRALFMAAVTLGYLKYSTKQARLVGVFCRWCDAKEIPCVSFEIESDRVDIMSTNDSVEKDDPFGTMHFDVTTAGRPFTKAGLVAVTEHLLGKLWDLALSPWKISAGVIPFSHAREIMAHVYEVWDTTSEPKAESAFQPDRELKSSDSQTIQ